MDRRCMGCMEIYDASFDVCPHCGYIYGTPAKEAYHILPGSVLKERYTVGKVLGFGGFGITYIGYDRLLEMKVAIKEYLPGEFSTRIPGQYAVTVYTGEREEQFNAGKEKVIDEARRLAAFQKVPNIVHIYDCFEENNTAYIVMEFCDGESVKEALARDGKMPVERALDIVLKVIAGMKEVHGGGLIHRDIAPDNIYILKDGSIKILDFGAARYATTKHSKSLSVIIKPGYAPEEQYRSRGDQGTWTDVYALAATFYKMITGVTPEDAMERSVKDLLKKPSKMGVAIPKAMETALLNALNVTIEDRTQSMEEFEKELLAAEVREKVARQRKRDVGKIPLAAKITAGVGTSVVLCMAAALLLFGKRFDRFDVRKGDTVVPNFIGLSKTSAEEEADKNVLLLSIAGTQFSTLAQKDCVLKQEIAAGTLVKENDTVQITLSRGREAIDVPQVLDLPRAEAEQKLKEKGFRVELHEVSAKDHRAGTVVTQQPDAAQTLVKGGIVYLEIAMDEGQDTAPAENAGMTVVPDILGKTEEEARTLFEAAELGMDIRHEYSDTVPAGVILAQEPSAGENAQKGSRIVAVISDGKELVMVPQGIQYNLSEAEAKQILEEQGFVTEVQRAKQYSSVRAGYVELLSVPEGTMAEKGSRIVITVSIGPKPPETRETETRAPKKTAAPETPAPTAAPQTAAPETPAPTAAPQTAAPETPAPTAAPQTAAPETPAPAGGDGAPWTDI
ncbi:MAG: PASTA domain-containing protein [Stomatobaculum sp.]